MIVNHHHGNWGVLMLLMLSASRSFFCSEKKFGEARNKARDHFSYNQ